MKRKIILWAGGIFLLALFFGFLSVPQLSGIVGKGTILGSQVGAGALAVTGTGGVTPGTSPSGGTFMLDNIQTHMVEKYSESETAANGGHIEVFRKGVDPKSSTATALATITIGTAYTTLNLRCDEVYRVVYENSTQAYSQDLGEVVLVPCSDSTPDLADAYIDFSNGRFNIKREAIATLSDLLDETVVANINGQTNTSQNNSQELHCAAAFGCAADGTLVYNETNADGQVYIDLTIASAGSNAELKDPVLCFRHDLTNTPEKNEISSIDLALRTGTDLGFGSPNWANTWANEECAKSSLTHMQAGISSTYRMTFNIVESNLDTAGDQFSVVFDDLGGDRATDIRNNRGATADTVAFSSGS